jgi:hypothetical protein
MSENLTDLEIGIIFNFMDSDNSGTLDIDEIFNLLISLKINLDGSPMTPEQIANFIASNVTDAELRRVFYQMDTDGNGTIDLHEFHTFVNTQFPPIAKRNLRLLSRTLIGLDETPVVVTPVVHPDRGTVATIPIPITMETTIEGISFATLASHSHEFNRREAEAYGLTRAQAREMLNPAESCIEIHRAMRKMLYLPELLQDLCRIAHISPLDRFSPQQCLTLMTQYERLLTEGLDVYDSMNQSVVNYTRDERSLALHWILYDITIPEGLSGYLTTGFVYRGDQALPLQTFFRGMIGFYEKLKTMGLAGQIILAQCAHEYFDGNLNAYNHTVRSFNDQYRERRDPVHGLQPQFGPEGMGLGHVTSCGPGNADRVTHSIFAGITAGIQVIEHDPRFRARPIDRPIDRDTGSLTAGPGPSNSPRRRGIQAMMEDDMSLSWEEATAMYDSAHELTTDSSNSPRRRGIQAMMADNAELDLETAAAMYDSEQQGQQGQQTMSPEEIRIIGIQALVEEMGIEWDEAADVYDFSQQGQHIPSAPPVHPEYTRDMIHQLRRQTETRLLARGVGMLDANNRAVAEFPSPRSPLRRPDDRRAAPVNPIRPDDRRAAPVNPIRPDDRRAAPGYIPNSCGFPGVPATSHSLSPDTSHEGRQYAKYATLFSQISGPKTHASFVAFICNIAEGDSDLEDDFVQQIAHEYYAKTTLDVSFYDELMEAEEELGNAGGSRRFRRTRNKMLKKYNKSRRGKRGRKSRNGKRKMNGKKSRRR